MPKTIAFRVDGNSKMGTGHLARCRILAEACLKRGWKVFWMTSFPSGRRFAPGGKTKIVSVVPGLADRKHAQKINRSLCPGDVVVLDGYHFGLGLEKELRRLGLKVVTVDDNAKRSFAADWILNGNVHAQDLRYRHGRDTRLALGPDYFIFSDEVRKARRASRIVRGDVQKILVTMGGADPSNQALKVLRAIELAAMPGISVVVIAGAANPHFQKIRRFAKSASYPCRVLRATSRIGAEMTKADFSIGSAGRIATEMAFLGLPGLRIVLADNQKGLIAKIHREGAAINLGWYRRLTPGAIARQLERLMHGVALRRKMSHKGRSMLDGKGTDRILKILASL